MITEGRYQALPSMAMLVNFLERMRLGVTRMQLWPHVVRLPVLDGEKMLNSPPQGMLSSLHAWAKAQVR